MSINLVELANHRFGNPELEDVSKLIKAPVEQIRTALDIFLPALIVRVTKKGSTDTGARSLMDFIAKHQHVSSQISPESMFSEPAQVDRLLSSGSDILKYMTGDKLGALIDLISERTGMPHGSVSRLTKLTAPLLIGVLAREIEGQDLDHTGVKGMLLEQDKFLTEETTPAVAKFQRSDERHGEDGIIKDSPTNDPFGTPEAVAGERPLVNRLLPWIILLLATLALLYFIGRGCSGPTADANSKQSTVKMTTLGLPNGVEIKARAGSCISEMYATLNNGQANPVAPFVFETVSFETGTTQLTPDSYSELDHLVALLEAYPEVSIRLDGHTDNTGGSAKSNLELSNRMAMAIKSYLQGQGVDRNRIRALGRGQTKPVASNNSDEGRNRNRRIEVYLKK